MINLMLGTNFDPVIPIEFKKLNTMYNDIQISEVYGSIKDFRIFGSARPDFRLPNISLDSLKNQIQQYGSIKVNYTENTPIVNKVDIDLKQVEVKLKLLKSFGISRLTLAHPLAMEIVANYSNIPVEVSTIYSVTSPFQLRELKKRCPNINKVCLDIDHNRNFNNIKRIKSEADKLEIEVELLANEFCIFDCIDRVQCYNEHTQIKTDEETSKFKRYPMGRCITARQNPYEWMRARFILPQHMRWYGLTCKINNFKITGRTHPTPYILWIAKQYLNQNYEENLIQLWADVKNIKRVSQGKDFLVPDFEINAKQFDENFLWDYWNHPEFNYDTNLELIYLKNYEL